jgi:ADP-ribose pyrophosphatase YjhB (NUDIX family)
MQRVWLSGGKQAVMPESVWKPNVTVAALIADNDNFLLVREIVKNRTVFNQPAGHLEEGESLIDAVIRETLEETQYQFSPTGLVGVYRFSGAESPDVTYLRFCFSGSIGECSGGALDKGIIAAEWMTFDEIRTVQSQHRSPIVLQCIIDFLNNQPYSLDVISSVYA